MLPKKYKLDAKEVELVMTKGKFVTTDLFLLKFLKIPIKNDPKTGRQQTPFMRISVISPKKPFNTAVLRNLIRRRVYSAVKPVFDRALPSAQTDFQILACLVCNKSVENKDLKELIAGVEHVFHKGAIIQ